MSTNILVRLGCDVILEKVILVVPEGRIGMVIFDVYIRIVFIFYQFNDS